MKRVSYERLLRFAEAATPKRQRRVEKYLFPRMARGHLTRSQEERILKTLSERIKVGIRTLVAAYREVKAADPERREASDAAERAGPYLVSGGAIKHEKDTQQGPVTVPLCNFVARIIGEEVTDDGAEQQAHFVIEGKLQAGRALPAVRIPTSRFPPLNWLTEHWGNGPIVYAGQARDHLRAAIQLLSGEVPRRTTYTHLGWRQIGGSWMYLNAGGAIGEQGSHFGIEVTPGDGRLSYYELPDPPDDPREAVRASLRLTDLAPHHVSYPLLACTYRAPLCSSRSANLTLFLLGQSGTFKTELTALCQAHWGAGFNSDTLPANWKDTANAMEKKAFLAKDAVLVVDDFSPAGTQTDVARQHREAERLLRAQGNRAGRTRMRPDGSLRAEYYPRGIIVSSGEDAPSGYSLRARVLFVEVERGDIDPAVLTEKQRKAASGAYATAMSAYLRWLAARVDRLDRLLEEKHRELRAYAAQQGAHRRTPDQVASLALGFAAFLAFAKDVGALTDAELDRHWRHCWAALGKAAAMQAAYQASEDPVTRFTELLSAALATKQAHVVASADGGQPDEPGAWGWRVRSSEYGEGATPAGDLIGWLDTSELWLEPDAAYSSVQKLARSQGGHITTTARTLWKRMDERDLLGATDPGRHTARKMVDGKRRRIVPILLDHLSTPESVQSVHSDESRVTDANVPGPAEKIIGPFLGKTGPQKAVHAQGGPVSEATWTGTETEPVHETTSETPSHTDDGPIGPIGPVSEDDTGPRPSNVSGRGWEV